MSLVLDLRPETGIADNSPEGNDGAYNGGMGVADGAFVSDGVNDRISLPILPIVEEFSILAWLTVGASSGSYGLVLGREVSGSPFQYYSLHVSGSGLVSAAVTTGGARKFINQVNVGFAIDSPQYLAVTYDGANLTVYLDGVSKVSLAATGSVTSGGSAPQIAGSLHYSAEWLSAEITRIAVFNTALTGSQLAAITDNDPIGEVGRNRRRSGAIPGL